MKQQCVMKKQILSILTALTLSSSAMCQGTDSVKVSKNDLITAVEIFRERDFLEKVNANLENQLALERQKFARAVSLDSLKIDKMEMLYVTNRSLERKARRRLYWSVSLGSMDALLFLLLLKAM